LVVLLAIALFALIFPLTRLASSLDPSYQGKTLSQWIVPFCRQTTNGLDVPAGPDHFEELQPVRRAVSNLGTNALPFLIASLNHRESALHRTVRQFLDNQHWVPFRLADPHVRRIRAIRALANLGPAAQPAIPSLMAQLNDPVLSQHAVYALSGMGTDGMRALIEQFNTLGGSSRHLVALTLTTPTAFYRGENYVETNQIPAELLIQGLLLVAQDSTPGFRPSAVDRLGMLGPAASNAVQTLLSFLHDQNPMTRHFTLRALGQIKARPDLVIPALTNLLSDHDLGVQMAAVSTLSVFGYNAQPQPHMSDALQRVPFMPRGTNWPVPGPRF
jgi:HEAT repeat protein